MGSGKHAGQLEFQSQQSADFRSFIVLYCKGIQDNGGGLVSYIILNNPRGKSDTALLYLLILNEERLAEEWVWLFQEKLYKHSIFWFSLLNSNSLGFVSIFNVFLCFNSSLPMNSNFHYSLHIINVTGIIC